MNEKTFYDKRSDWDFSHINYESEKSHDWNFFDRIQKFSDKDSVCLDLGTGGGEKLLKNYPDVYKIIGTDYSVEMINTAKSNLEISNRKNVQFMVMDNLNLDFPDNYFDLISARHTVISAKEIHRLLKKCGYVVVQGVDKDDCIELKNIFKRGQAYNDKKSISEIDLENLRLSGFQIVEYVKVNYSQYYKTEDDLMELLLKTPILDDFSEKTLDRKRYPIEENLFSDYVKNFRDSRGIKLNRVLYGIVGVKK